MLPYNLESYQHQPNVVVLETVSSLVATHSITPSLDKGTHIASQSAALNDLVHPANKDKWKKLIFLFYFIY